MGVLLVSLVDEIALLMNGHRDLLHVIKYLRHFTNIENDNQTPYPHNIKPLTSPKRTFMPKNPTLHLESTILSYPTARPSRDLVAAQAGEAPDMLLEKIVGGSSK